MAQQLQQNLSTWGIGPASYATIQLSATSLHWDWCSACFVGHSVSYRLWRLCNIDPVGPFCCVWHGRPWHPAVEATYKLRHWRYCPQVVPVLFDRPYPARTSRCSSIDLCLADLWCSTGVSFWANFVHHVYSWLCLAHPAVPPITTLIRRRYTDLWLVFATWRRVSTA